MSTHSLERVSNEHYVCSAGDWGTVAEPDQAASQFATHTAEIKAEGFAETTGDETASDDWRNPFVISSPLKPNSYDTTGGDQPK